MTHFWATTFTDTDHALAVVVLSGDCDLAAKDEMTDVLTAAARRSATVLVDLRHVGFLDTSGIHALVAGYEAAHQNGRSLFVINANEIVSNVLDITGLANPLRPPDDYQDESRPPSR